MVGSNCKYENCEEGYWCPVNDTSHSKNVPSKSAEVVCKGALCSFKAMPLIGSVTSYTVNMQFDGEPTQIEISKEDFIRCVTHNGSIEISVTIKLADG